jgi:hypothetical protein
MYMELLFITGLNGLITVFRAPGPGCTRHACQYTFLEIPGNPRTLLYPVDAISGFQFAINDFKP